MQTEASMYARVRHVCSLDGLCSGSFRPCPVAAWQHSFRVSGLPGVLVGGLRHDTPVLAV
eukprot:363414-Chlamydomonas_euryale.AAC.9